MNVGFGAENDQVLRCRELTRRANSRYRLLAGSIRGLNRLGHPPPSGIRVGVRFALQGETANGS